jgi:hypothetical protein
MFPVSLSDIQFKATNSVEDTLTASVSFRYDFFEIEKLDA